MLAKLSCKALRMCRTFKSAKCLKLSFRPSMGGGCPQRQVKAKRIKVFKAGLCYMRPCLPQCPPAYLHTYKKSRQSGYQGRRPQRMPCGNKPQSRVHNQGVLVVT